MNVLKCIFVFLFWFSWIECAEDEIYSYNGIYGCECFSHCKCFSHYIGPFKKPFEHLQDGAFPLDDRFHPKKNADIAWHHFMKGILTAKRDGPYFDCNSNTFWNMISRNGRSPCMLNEYLDLIEYFRKFYVDARDDSIKFQNRVWEKDCKAKSDEIQRVSRQAETAHQILDGLSLTIIPLYKNILTNCPHADDHYNMAFVYNQGLINFYEDNYEGFAANAERFIQLATIHDKKNLLNSKFYQLYGESQIKVYLYHKAIESLSLAIERDPNNKEAYFHRAIAYFEVGDFNQALRDYLFSEKSKEVSGVTAKISNEFYQALLGGLTIGGRESLTDFFPSLWHSAKGIGHTLWIFAEHPVDTTINFANLCYEMADSTAEFFAAFDWDTAEEYAVEFRQLMEGFKSLSETEKGHLIGYSIGRYGLDIFAGGATVKGISALKKLKEANRICNLEAITISNVNKEKIASMALTHASERELFFKNIKIHWDSQNKHIPGKHNYELGRSIFEHKNAETLLETFAGTGKPLNNFAPGPNYKELVDFGEYIGIWINKENTISLPTTKGVIHYSKRGAHIIPTNPG